MLSIIIPTLNEEENLPQLLESIKKQDFADYEIIVSDAASQDKTLEIAQKYGCKITKGGLPAKGRNNGAKVATGDTLFFLDADTTLPDYFLTASLQEFNSRNLSIASFGFDSHSKNTVFQAILNFYNTLIVALEKTLPYTAIGILVSKNVFEEIGGYNEKLKLSEDHDMGRRAANFGKFGIISSVKIFVSDRRFINDGWFTVVIKYILSELHVGLIGPITSDIFKYKFDHYKEKK